MQERYETQYSSFYNSIGCYNGEIWSFHSGLAKEFKHLEVLLKDAVNCEYFNTL